MDKLLTLSERVFTILAFIHYAGSPLYVILSDGLNEGDYPEVPLDLPIINHLFLTIYIISTCLLFLRWKKVIYMVSKGKFIWLLIGLAILSIYWSFSPELTKTRVVALIGSMAFSLYFASRYSIKEQIQLLSWAFGIGTISSIIFVIFIPKYGIMGGVHMGAWRGIYSHKNGLGRTMVPSSIIFLLSALTAQKRRWIFWSLFTISVALLLCSRAASPVIHLIILMGIFFSLHILRWNYLWMIPALIGVSAIGTILYSLLTTNAGQIAGAFGKNLTLTGRTDFWPLILDKIWEKPWLGYGFGAFWQGYDGPSAYIWNASTFKAPNGHNGYLDLCLELGFVGLTIYSIEFINSFQKAIAYIRSRQTPDTFWPVLMLCLVVLVNLTESSLVMQNNLLWTIQVSTFLSLCMPLPNDRLVLDRM
jgi:exopolysaccharide production protein ExoQ